MGLFPRVPSATPPAEPEPEPEQEPGRAGDEETAESLRQEGGKRRRKKREKAAGPLPQSGDGAAAARRKGKAKVSREHMLLSRLEKLGESYKDDGETLVELAMLYSDKGSWAPAIHYFKLALRALPSRREAIVPPLANAYFQSKLFEEAQFLYQDAVRKPEHVRTPAVWYHLGVIYERQEKFDIAEYCLRHCLTLLPPLGRDVEVHCRLAACANRLGRPTDAVACYKEACTAAAVSPRSTESGRPWISEGFVWFEQGLMYDALEESKLAQVPMTDRRRHGHLRRPVLTGSSLRCACSC
jgi:tetratricopeptide (TPR) repeat protein